MKLAFYLGKYGGLQGQAIAAFTGGPYSHVEMVFEAPYLPTPRVKIWPHDKGGSVCYTSSPAAPRSGCGFQAIDLADGKWFVKDLPAANWAAALDLAIKDNGRPYDWRGVVGFIVKGQDNKAERFCSEECVLLLQAAGLLLGVNAVTTSPNNIARLMGVL